MPLLVLAAWVVLLAAGAVRWQPPPARIAALAAPSRQGHSGARRRLRRARLAALALLAVALAVLWPPLALAAAGLGLAAPWWRRRRAAHRERAAVVAGLPEVADLLVLAVGSGLTPLLALRRLAPLAPPPFAPALAEVVQRVDRGVRLADALDALPARLGEPVRPVVAALTATERYGTPLSPALDALAHDARQERRRAAEISARQLPVRLSFPLVVCILPAFVLLTIAPLVAGALDSLRL
jgi:tight adherence protein C